MKAVNLIPAEERRGAGGAAGRTGGGAYVIIGALALLVLMLVALATTTRSRNDQQAKLAELQRQAATTEAKAADLAPYAAFAALRTTRVATVKSIADSRFDWAGVMRELGRTLPRNITLTALTGTVSTSSAKSGGAAVPLRTAYDVPAVELVGCAPSQAAIPPMLASLRQVDGVRRVTLQQSVKSENTTAASSTATADGTQRRAPDCRRSFQAVIFFDAPPAAAGPAVAAAPGTVAAAPGTAPAAPGAGTSQNVNGGPK